MKRKISCFALMALFLVGCNGGTSSNDVNDSKDDENTTPEVIANKYLLPSSVTRYNSLYEKDIDVIKYSYFDDLHGYLKTEVVDYDTAHYKVEEKFIFNDDFKKCEYLKSEYEYNNEKKDYVLNRKQLEEREFLENKSMKTVCYEFDFDKNDFVYDKETGVTYNERGQILLRYTKRQDDDDETKFYYSDYQLYEYDEDGYQLKYSSYDYKDDDSGEFFADYYSEYVYTNNRTHCRVDSYYWYGDKYEKDGYEEIEISKNQGIICFDQQSYDNNDEPGNHNVTKYTEDFYPIYVFYGGIPQSTTINLNEYGQIDNYVNEDDVGKVQASAIYAANGKEMVESTVRSEHSLGQYTYKTTFERSDIGQITKAIREIDYTELDSRGIYSEEFTVTYSERTYNKLYEQMDFENELISDASFYGFIERII